MEKKMMRHNDDKPKLSYILDFPTAMTELSKVMEMGAEKYDQNNWKKGGSIREMENSLLRHVMDFHNCKDDDAESKRHHLAHAMFNAAGIIEHQAMHGDEFDDRDWEHAYER